ncbi:MAG: hypothetical protein ISP41_07755 [Alphaproteobacteria bacterium]|nr:hypothetical protein [Alphaproteobacteria bacterium]
MERKLAAILAADVVGYSRLIGADEAGTLALLRALLTDVVEPTMARHRGRIVKLMGDGVLAEFASAVDAVVAAVEIQEALPERSAHLPEERRMALRVGVNLGDVVVDDGDLFGDGVNIAARLQEVASTGGVAISDDVYRQLRGKLDLPFQDGGERSLKNIAEPVRIWTWTPIGGQTIAAVAAPATPTDKPSIAVLPFENMSGEAEQEFFADGMTEDIITGLSRFRSLFVIPRNSTISYKGRSPDPKTIARELGVRYVLEGSVRRGGNRIRVTGQLIDAEAGGHLWSERFDAELTDIFKVQDDVTDAIVTAIAPEIDKSERGRAERKPPDSLDAWSLYQRGLIEYHATTKESMEAAIQLFDRVNELDPNFAPGFAMAADARVRLYAYFVNADERTIDLAVEKSRHSVALDPHDPICHLADARVNSHLGRHEIAISRAEEGVRLNPSSSMTHHSLGFVLGRAGRPEEAFPHIEQAVRLGPRDIFLPGYLGFGAAMLFLLERYEEAAAWGQRSINNVNPRPPNFAFLVASLTLLDRPREANAVVADMRARSGFKTIRDVEVFLDRNPVVNERAGTLITDALRKAGLPE